MTLRFLSVVLASLFAVACDSTSPANFENGTWIDLTHDVDDRSLYWPTTSPFVLTTVAEGQTEGGYYYSAYAFTGSEHGGTHLDAPIHFQADGLTTEQVPLDSMIGPVIVIDVKTKTQTDRRYGIQVEDILAWEAVHGRINNRPIVLFDTGWAARWPDAEDYLGTARRGPGGVPELSFPGITPDAADFLANEREVRAVGLDTPSLDLSSSASFLAHRILFDQNIPGFENVAALDRLPPRGAHVVALPMKIKGGSGGPLRIVAFVPDDL
ncbi:MAG: cyclase family protein [Pseudomonadota bacterium]